MKNFLCNIVVVILCLSTVTIAFAESSEPKLIDNNSSQTVETENLETDTDSNDNETNVNKADVNETEQTTVSEDAVISPMYLTEVNLTAEKLDVWPGENTDTQIRFNTDIEQGGFIGWNGVINGRSYSRCWKKCDSIKNTEKIVITGLNLSMSGGGFAISAGNTTATLSATVKNTYTHLHEFSDLKYSGVNAYISETATATFTRGSRSFSTSCSDGNTL